MKAVIYSFWTISFLIFSFLSCEKSDQIGKDTGNPGDVAKLVDQQNDFAWKILKEEIKQSTGKNILISPLSIHAAFSMASNGADKKTKEEIYQVLGVTDGDQAALNRNYQKLITLLTEQSGHPEVGLANAYFYDKNRITLKADFIDILENYFNCTFLHKNFNEEDKSKNEINQWVKEITKDRIEGIVDRITPLDVSFLINALYFKSDWSYGFGKESVIRRNFLQSDGKTPELDFVTGDRNIPFVITSEYSVADIPFKDSTFSLSLILPASSENNFDRNTYESLMSKLQYSRLFIGFPKMNLSYKNGLIPSLKALGISEAFDQQLADFTRMGIANQNIFIDQIQHKCILKVDEKGAEGAAVTLIGFGITSAPPTIIFDKPYYLVLRHISSGAILFSGFVGYNPSE